MGGVEDDRGEDAHDRQGTHVDDKVVVTEAGSAFSEADTIVARLFDFLNRMTHVCWGDELTLFYIDSSACSCGGFGCGDE